MDISIFSEAAQLGGTVFVTVVFIYYLTKRDKALNDIMSKSADANITLATALQRLTDTVLANTGSKAENTIAVGENTSAVDKNTAKVNKDTNGK